MECIPEDLYMDVEAFLLADLFKLEKPQTSPKIIKKQIGLTKINQQNPP